MKNTSYIILLSVTFIFIGIMVGIYIGRASNSNYIDLSYTPTTHINEVSNIEQKPQIVKININTAKESDLTILPGIGESTAKKIIEYREKYGPFIRIDDVVNVKGISQKRFEEISKYITVGG